MEMTRRGHAGGHAGDAVAGFSSVVVFRRDGWVGFRTCYTAQNYMCLVLFEPGLCRLVGLLIGGVWVNDNNFCVDFGEGFGA